MGGDNLGYSARGWVYRLPAGDALGAAGVGAEPALAGALVAAPHLLRAARLGDGALLYLPRYPYSGKLDRSLYPLRAKRGLAALRQPLPPAVAGPRHRRVLPLACRHAQPVHPAADWLHLVAAAARAVFRRLGALNRSRAGDRQ